MTDDGGAAANFDVLLSFESIAGMWGGYLEENIPNDSLLWMKAHINPAAVLPDVTAGTIEYGRGAFGQNVDCRGEWIAVHVEADSVFTLFENVMVGRTLCPDGEVILRRQTSDSLLYEFEPTPPNPNLEATGYLVRQ